MRKIWTWKSSIALGLSLGSVLVLVAGLSNRRGPVDAVPMRPLTHSEAEMIGEKPMASTALVAPGEIISPELATANLPTDRAQTATKTPTTDEIVAEASSVLSDSAESGLKSAAFVTLEQAARHGNVKALVVLGNAYREGKVTEADPQRAVAYLRKADELGNSGASLALGFMFARGDGVSANVELAVQYLERAVASRENSGALKLLGDLYRATSSPVYDVSRARGYYERAAALKNDAACLALADMWRRGEGGTKSDREARRFYERALSLGNNKALLLLANLYQTGDSSVKDPVAAAQYYLKAARLGDEKAILAFGQQYAREGIVGVDPSELISLLDSIASGSNESQARKLLGDIYRAKGATQSVDRAMENYRRAADLGNGSAMLALGDLIREKEEDTDEAKALYEAAGDLGVARAYIRLGDLAWFARDDDAREVTSLYYYQKAELLGDNLASLRLARIEQGQYRSLDSIEKATRRYQVAIETVGPDQTVKQMLNGDPNGLIAIVQLLLAAHGYDVGAVDGMAGRKTVDGIDAFCREQQISKCEGREVLAALLRPTVRTE